MTETITLSRAATEALEASGMERPLADFVGDLQKDANADGTTFVINDYRGDLLDVVEPAEPGWPEARALILRRIAESN